MKLTLKRGLLFGLLLGIVSAFLYAPKSGKELRYELKEKVESVPKNFLAFLESLLDLFVSVLDFAKTALEEQTKKFSKAVTTGMSVAKEKSKELKRFTTNIASR
ncbi:MAG: YtxH domain-containing protein [Candidatus Melainabacteria bacterium]|nr:YtxH domain-containing protein [Candidatus Melainabacteria bacterium]